MRNYTCRTCKELSRQPLQREIARRRELEADTDTNLHNTLLHAPSRIHRMSDSYSQLGIGRATA
jgi:hypothetical protein